MTIYNSFNLERTGVFIEVVTIENVSKTYSFSNELKYDISDATEKHMLYKQFVGRNCNDCSIAPLTNYANNSIYQKLYTEKIYLTHAGERIHIDLRDSIPLYW